jgi:hypothetical protein
MLWLPPEKYIVLTPAGALLREHRNLFAGRWAYNAFIGYAKGQLHRMTHGAYMGYMGEKRKALVAQYGYDTKNASHLIRILRMGIEFLQTGDMLVDRGGLDATELLDIKHGEWTLDRIQVHSDRLFDRAEYAFAQSELPDQRDDEKINQLCVDVIELAHKEAA